MSRGDLEGVRVLDLSRLLPGPYLTLVLADLGADVVKIEDLGPGDYLRYVPPFRGDLAVRFAALNRGKRSALLDLKKPAGRDALLRLADGADVLVESFRPGVMDRLGLGWDTLRARNPRLIQCSLSGYGQTGPYRERAGHDLNYIALAGVLGMTGRAGGPPQQPGFQLADLAGGALWGLGGVLSALYARVRTGEGRWLDISMTDGALAFLTMDLAPHVGAPGEEPAPRRGEERLNGGVACYGVYETKDGRWLSVAPLEPKFWMVFGAIIGRVGDASELVAPPEAQARIRAEVAAILKTRTRDEWEAAFAGKDVCVEPVLDADELPGHPLHAARGTFFSVEDPRRGRFPQVRTPLGAAEGTPAPGPGEHTAAVLREAGFSDEEIAALVAAGAAR